MARFDWWREDEPEGTSVQAIVDRVQAEWRAEKGGEQDQPGRPRQGSGAPPRRIMGLHDAPAYPLSVGEAHRTMQEHRTCTTIECPRKRTAWRTLIESGRVVPDSGRNY